MAGEYVVLSTYKVGRKLPAQHVTLVFYSREALSPTEEIEEDWGLVSINCSPIDKEVPMMPTTMARNYLEQTGGTKRSYTAKELADSIWFWSRHVMVQPVPQQMMELQLKRAHFGGSYIGDCAIDKAIEEVGVDIEEFSA